MKSRSEAVALIEKQLRATHEPTREKGRKYHYGRQELRELLDFIYDSKPRSEDEEIKRL